MAKKPAKPVRRLPAKSKAKPAAKAGGRTAKARKPAAKTLHKTARTAARKPMPKARPATRGAKPVAKKPGLKANHAKLQFASGGTGSATHLGCVLLNSTLGVDVSHVPYRSTALAVQDMIAGRIDYACPIASTALSQVQAKQLKAIAILTKTRLPMLSDLATAQEQGLSNFEAYIWNAIFLPKGAAPAIVAKLNDALGKTLDKPEVQNRLQQIGGEVVARDRRSPDYLRQFVTSEIAKWAVPIKAAAITID